MSNAFVGVLLKLNPILSPKLNPILGKNPKELNKCQYCLLDVICKLVSINCREVCAIGKDCAGECSQSKKNLIVPKLVVDGLQ